MLSTVSALGAQNIGAGKPDRAIQTLRYAVMLAAGFGVLASIAIQFTAEGIVSLFTDPSTADGAAVILSAASICVVTFLTVFLLAFILVLAAFLRMREIRPVVFTQYSRHCIDACAWRLCDLKIIPGNASPDGTGYRGRLTAIGRDLPNRLWSHTAQINACSGGGVRYGSEKSLPNR